MTNRILNLGLIMALGACAGTTVTRVQELSESADAPYDNVLVISLFKSFDARRYLEDAIVKELEARGVRAVASTSLMNTKTPVTRETFVTMVERLDMDAVLVTQLVSAASKAKETDRRPESTYNITSTGYYNVWNVELTEYVEPASLEFTHLVAMGTQVYSVASLEPVWAIETHTKIVKDFDRRGDMSAINDEASTIARYLSRDGLLSP